MKIATFNLNDVNKRLGHLIGWLRAKEPDLVALQELKAADREFPKAAIEKAGYGAVWRGQKIWNGVAILARGCEPIVTRRELPGDRQPSYIEAAINGVIITSLYAPNGNPQPGPKFDYKLAWRSASWRTPKSFTPLACRSCSPAARHRGGSSSRWRASGRRRCVSATASRRSRCRSMSASCAAASRFTPKVLGTAQDGVCPIGMYGTRP